MKRLSLPLILLLISLLAAGPAVAGTQDRLNVGGPLMFWPAGSVVRYAFVSGTISPGNDNALVRGAIRSALTTLMNSMPQQNGLPVVQFVEASSTASSNRIASDCINVITFTDSQDALDPSVIAQATMWTNPVDQPSSPCGGGPAKAGQIFQVDMNFNFAKAFSTNLVASQVYDIQALATHEGGHWLGLGHTGINSAVMSPYGDAGSYPVRLLTSDDIGTLTAIYAPSGATTISGKVADGTGAGVKGAHVVATNASTGVTTASALSAADGTYRIYGVASGQSYKVFAEPLDNPITLGSMPPGSQDGNSSFATTFANSGNGVSAPGSNINITIGSAGPAANLQAIGIVTGTTAASGPYPITLARGVKTTIVGQGAGINENSAVTLSSSKITVGKGSVTFGGAVCADLTVASDAVPGAVDIMTGGSVFAGGIVVATNPTLPSNGVTEGAAFNQGTASPHFAPGSLITLWGTDFVPAGTLAVATDMTFLPTQLAGTSVKIGNLLAPLYFVSPGQINATIPYELTAAQIAAGVDVTVLTGGNTQSAPAHITVASSAPRIMMNLGRFSEKMGLIQKWMPPPAASYPIADDKTPISAHDFLIIWAIGMGAASGPNGAVAVSGMNYDAVAINGVLTPNDAVTVTIAGRSVAAYSAALSPQYPSIAQVAVEVPSGLPTGLQPLTISTKNGASNTAMILIQ